jgi:LPXTG-motif cell wall-anchored protein
MTDTPETPTQEQLRADAERARVALGQTAQELADKFDVPARTKGAVQQVGVQVKEKWDDLPQPVRDGGRSVATTVRRQPAPFLAGIAALVLGLLLAKRRRRRADR